MQRKDRSGAEVGIACAWAGAAVLAGAPALANIPACPAPVFEVGALELGDDGRDRGYPGGLSLADFDGDGDLDLLATRGFDVTASPYRGDRSLLYLNDGTGRFSRSEHPFGDFDTPDSGASLADIDRDGDLDVYVTVQRRQPNRYLRNEGQGRFTVTPLGDATRSAQSNFSGVFVDIDSDGDLDLYTTGPTMEMPGPNAAYRNDEGVFRAVEDNPVLGGANNPGAALWGDLDADGDQDLIVANSDIARLSGIDPAPVEHAVLYRNLGGWTFEADPGQPFAAPGYSSMSGALADVDNDGDLDLFLGSYVYNTEPRTDWLFLNDGAGRFTLAPAEFPVHSGQSSGAAFADLNGDGALDLVTASYGGPIELFTGDGTGALTRREDAALAARVTGHSAVVSGDIDADGRIDVLVGAWSANAEGDFVTVLRNRTPACGSWVELRLVDRHGAPEPPGSRVVLTTRSEAGHLSQTRVASAQTGFRAQSASPFLFSVPPGHEIVEAVITWPDASQETLTGLAPGTRAAVRQPAAPDAEN
ncbi:CRTAC1 family protein [Marinicauda algicola]|uniref:CRTAC1 family protein n=1 Tax=Marinicauda algicola TaxID=2029849 RepID=A0A4S2H2M9_9PROT|nr:VCBS repeat-containing protein [Marinicauda algicola]TGY89847.1 CRTAC1 family protein [Marinicauda algicola]